ncbi:MAG TPA: polyprenyl synthetase family protein [Polyangiaceae bacterium]|jgi:geranylgeranyl pyrophosphate synthase|nr:polyprenyl synthetase family protein [Polyangiaceae bacterium]
MPSILSFEDAYQRYAGEIERRVREARATRGLIGEIITYHLSAGGKRMRALLPVWVCENLGGRPEAAFDLGAGLELLHNATLVHDDLQDGDRTRRGHPTVWARFGTAQAINVGDALIFTGLARIARAPAAPWLLESILEALGRVVEGQAMELQLQLPASSPEALSPTLETWERMARAKTGALFGACLRAGAAAAEVSQTVIERAARYGEDVGLLFQVQDDYLDLVGDKGRDRRCADLREGKRSFPVVWALEHGDAAAVAIIRRLLAAPRDSRTWEQVDDAYEALRRCGALAATAAWLTQALRAVDEDPIATVVPGWAKRCLAPVADVLQTERCSSKASQEHAANPRPGEAR